MLFNKNKYNKYRVEVKGMRCGMCESHVNDIIRKNFDVKKVKSSHFKNETIIESKNELNEEEIRKVISGLGYDVGKVEVING